jgi:hypothetical protein
MIHYVFSIYDDKAEAFLPPFVLPKEAQALRVFADCVNSDSHQFGQNPADYSIFRFGTWNDENGQFLLERTQHCLGNGVAFRKSQHPIAPEIRGNGIERSDDSQQPLVHEPPVQSGTIGEDSAE